MKRILILMSLTALTLAGCAEAYDDTEIKDMIEELEGRTAALKDLCDRVNTSITLVSRLEQARQLNLKVTQVVENEDENTYTVSFSDGSTLTVACPADGKDGYVGKPGEDAQVPSIGIEKVEGTDCWTLGGEIMKDEGGNPIPLYTFTDGEKTDGRTPQLKVEEGKWYYRFSDTDDWTSIGISVIYGDGNMFSSVQEDGDNVVFNLSAGGSITLPVARKFSLVFDSLSANVKAGSTVTLSYSLVTDDGAATVEVFAPVGWTASAADGTLTVSVPADASAGAVEQLIVFAVAENGESVYQVVNITVEEA